MDRRQFLKTTALLGGGVAVGFQLAGCAPSRYPGASGDLRPSAFVQLNSAGEIVLRLHKTEMGQGTYTGLTTLAAEELGIHPEQITVLQAGFHPDFRDPDFRVQITGGSSSLKNSMEPVREAAALLAALIKQAGSRHFGVSPDQLWLDQGEVHFGDQRVSYRELLPVAASLPLPKDVKLKSPEEYQYIGKFDHRLDSRDKVTGKAVFGLDRDYPDALFAVMLRCPHYGGSLKSFDAEEALQKPGVEKIFVVDGKIAVVAKGYWQARQAANLIVAEWNEGPYSGQSQADMEKELETLLSSEDRKTAEEEGDADDFKGREFTAQYQVPFLAHATMEPMNALAAATPEKLEIWTGVQAIDLVRDAIADATGYLPEQILIHNSQLGGGFGRRLCGDYLVEAARLSQELGKPVKLVWSREDDMRHDFYRPNALAKMTAKIDGDRVTGLYSQVVAPSIMQSFLTMVTNTLLPRWTPEGLHSFAGEMAAPHDPAATEGIVKSPYQLGYTKTDFIQQQTAVQVGYWRSVGHSQNAFFIESFIDELAHETGQDPLTFRRALLPADSRHHRVLDLVAEKANWGNPPDGQFQGLAVHESFDTVVAQVAEVSVEHGQIKVHRVVCALDCGFAVNPDIVTMQMESGIIFGLTAALKGKITFRDGAVQQSNFHDYELLRLFESPDIEVYRVETQASPSGVGEPGVPPIAAAVANAVFAASGQRLRHLPLTLNVA